MYQSVPKESVVEVVSESGKRELFEKHVTPRERSKVTLRPLWIYERCNTVSMPLEIESNLQAWNSNPKRSESRKWPNEDIEQSIDLRAEGIPNHETYYKDDSVPESKRSLPQSRRSLRKETPHTREDQVTEHTKQNETEHIKIRRINTRTDLLMCLVQCSERSLRIKRHTERVGQWDSTSEMRLDFRYSEYSERAHWRWVWVQDTWNESSIRSPWTQAMSRSRTRMVICPATWRWERLWTVILSSPARSRKSEFGHSLPRFASKQQDRERT